MLGACVNTSLSKCPKNQYFQLFTFYFSKNSTKKNLFWLYFIVSGVEIYNAPLIFSKSNKNEVASVEKALQKKLETNEILLVNE